MENQNVKVILLQDYGFLIGDIEYLDKGKVRIHDPFIFDQDEDGDTIIRHLLIMTKERYLTCDASRIAFDPLEPNDRVLANYLRCLGKIQEDKDKNAGKKDPKKVVLFERDKSN